MRIKWQTIFLKVFVSRLQNTTGSSWWLCVFGSTLAWNALLVGGCCLSLRSQLKCHFLRKTFPNSKGNMWSLPLQFFIDLIWLNLSKVAIFLSFKKICLWFFILTGNDIANFYLIHHWILCILAYSSWCMCGSVIQYMCIFGKILCGIYSTN